MSHYYAKCQVVRCIKDLRKYKKFNMDDVLVKYMVESAIKELRFFYYNRFNLENCRTNSFGKYYYNLQGV